MKPLTIFLSLMVSTAYSAPPTFKEDAATKVKAIFMYMQLFVFWEPYKMVVDRNNIDIHGFRFLIKYGDDESLLVTDQKVSHRKYQHTVPTALSSMIRSGSDLDQEKIWLRFVIKNRDGEAFLDIPIHYTETFDGGKIDIVIEEAKTQIIYQKVTSEAIMEVENPAETSIDITETCEETIEEETPTAIFIDTFDIDEDILEGENPTATSIDTTNNNEETMEGKNPTKTSIVITALAIEIYEDIMEGENPTTASIDSTDNWEETMEGENPTTTSIVITDLAEANMEGADSTSTKNVIPVASEVQMDMKKSTMKDSLESTMKAIEIYEDIMKGENPTTSSIDATVYCEETIEGETLTASSIVIHGASDALMEGDEIAAIILIPVESEAPMNVNNSIRPGLTAGDEEPDNKFQNPLNNGSKTKPEVLIGVVLIYMSGLAVFVIYLLCKKKDAPVQNYVEYGENIRPIVNPEEKTVVVQYKNRAGHDMTELCEIFVPSSGKSNGPPSPPAVLVVKKKRRRGRKLRKN